MLFDRLSGSLKSRAWAEVRRQRLRNPDFRRNQDPLYIRALRTLLGRGGFTTALLGYVLIATIGTGGEIYNDLLCRVQDCTWLLPGSLTRTERAEDILREVAGFMMGAQTGLLGVLSIAVALVTLIGQRAHASADVRVYYHESFAVPLAGSSLALLAVLCLQLFWPIEMISPWYGVHSANLTAEVILTSVHLIWLIGNVALYARFILISLSFGQDDRRVRYRNLYTANVVAPRNIFHAIIRAQYVQCSSRFRLPHNSHARISMGYYFLTPPVEALAIDLGRPSRLDDVWLIPLSVAIWLWALRIGAAEKPKPTLVFMVDFDRTIDRRQVLCRTHIGQEFTVLERMLIKLSFRFRRTA